MTIKVNEGIQKLINKDLLKIVKDNKGNYYCLIRNEKGNSTAYTLYENGFKISLRKLYFQNYKELLSPQDVQSAVEIIEVIGTDDVEEVEVCKRIFNNGSVYAYELNREEGTVVWIEDGEVSIEKVEGIIFRHAANYADQVKPNLKIRTTKLLEYMKKHFNLKSDREVILLTLFLVTSFWGLGINHPMLVLTGEKGSSKSTTLRKLERLIDPKSSDLGGGIPKGNDGLEIRLSNSYFVTLNNLSSLSRKVSDILAVAITGGCTTKRALYKNTDEIVLDLKAVVAINGVSLVARESDLLDRSLIITLKRISSDAIVTEEELWKEFERDRPKILGCCFKILATVLNDTKEIKTQEKTRMADFHVACIKVGRALGISEDEVSSILWENQRNVNNHTLDQDIVALCVIELMKDRKEYINSMANLLCDLLDIVGVNGMSSTVLPQTPNHLSNRLSKAKSNLQSEHGIVYNIKNTGTFKQITIKKDKKLAKVAKEGDSL